MGNVLILERSRLRGGIQYKSKLKQNCHQDRTWSFKAAQGAVNSICQNWSILLATFSMHFLTRPQGGLQYKSKSKQKCLQDQTWSLKAAHGAVNNICRNSSILLATSSMHFLSRPQGGEQRLKYCACLNLIRYYMDPIYKVNNFLI